MSRDAIIISDSDNTTNNTNAETNEDIDDTINLVCSNCQFSEPKDEIAWYSGDCCPNCRKSYLSTE